MVDFIPIILFIILSQIVVHLISLIIIRVYIIYYNNIFIPIYLMVFEINHIFILDEEH